MNKILLGAVALIVVFAAFIFLASKNTSAPSLTQPAIEPTLTEAGDQAVNVILGDSGFVPKDITVKTGITVVWINKSGKPATVNSDNHPNHLLYPFLNLGEFPDSSSLQVTFDKAGKYGYHDHFNPIQTGTVTVE